jgi:hypothetical protein
MLSGGLTQKRQLFTAQDFIDIEQYFYTALHLVSTPVFNAT